jgi:hypothetical protein
MPLLQLIQRLPVEEYSRRIDGLVFDHVSPISNRVKVFKGDAPGIDSLMTGHAGRVVAMIFEPLLQRELRDFGIGDIDFGNRRGRRRWWVVEQAFQQPNTTPQRI